jgi:sarcosine oxidase gamma subunit
LRCGSKARRVPPALLHSPPLDLRPASTPVGAALRTRFGDIGVLVACTDDAPTYLLLADQSYTPYLLHLIGQSVSLG